jgi:hypothetical protein
MTAVNDLISSPDFLAYKFDFNTEKISFIRIDRDEIRRVSALKLEYIDPDRRMFEVPLSSLTGLMEAANGAALETPPRFIFHTAFCASTFLARCLDVEGVSISLREPQILLDAANAKRLQWRSKTTRLGYRDLPGLALRLLQKHASPSEKLIIKPINSVNNIIPELLQLTGQTKSLLLYTDARNFLLSTLRKGEGGKHVIRAMFDLIRCDFPHLSNLTISSMIHMTDWNIILTLWRLQIEQAESVLRQFAPGHIMASLYGEELIHNPLQVLTAASKFLDLGLSNDRIREIANSDERQQDAKTSGQTFSVDKRRQTYQKLEQFYGAELDQVLNWMLKNNPAVQLLPKLSGSLI